MIDLIALSAAKKHADLLAMGLTSVSVDNTNKSITFTLTADGSQRTIYFDQPSDGVSIIGVEIKNGHLICLMSDGSEIDAGVLPSGGSGGSVPKPLTYDYMPEGYPSKSIQTVTLMEEQEVAFSELEEGIYAAVSPVQFELTEGETYTVVWDGVEYKCVCYTAGPTGGVSYIGNPAAFGLEATGEPFFYTLVEMGYIWASYDTATTHTIGVTTSPEIITPMSYDYMPEGYPKKRGQSIEWNGNTEGLVSVLEMLYKVSDLLPTYDELIGSTVELSNGEKVKITSDCIRAVSEDIKFIEKGDLFIAVVKKDNAIFNDTTFPQKGTYFAKQQNKKAAQKPNIYVKKLTEAITPMAEEFMPPRITEAIDAVGEDIDRIATVAHNAQSTANNAQSTANNAQSTANNAVKYTASQNLTDAQKQQARMNIGAGTSSFSGNYNDLANKPTIVQGDWDVNNDADMAYIKNRTHYDYTKYTEIPLFGDRNPVASSLIKDTYYYGEKTGSSLNITSGNIYKVSCSNGTTYISTCRTVRIPGQVISYSNVLGNARLGADAGYLDGTNPNYPITDTGEPWCFISYSNTAKNAIISTISNFKIYSLYIQSAHELKQLDEKYIPSTIAKTSDVPTDDHIKGLINTALSAIGIAEEGAY